MSCRPFWLAVAMAGALSSSLYADEWYESYHKAEEALAREEWNSAVRELNAAIERAPTSSANARTYGMRFIHYYPYLQLGIAYSHLDQPAAALQAFETEQRQGEIGKSPDALAKLQSFRLRIEQQQSAKKSETENRATTILADSVAAAERLQRQGRLDDALAAIGNALAVAPENGRAQELHRQLLAASAEAQRRQQEDDRIARLLRDGQAALAASRFGEAAAAFSEALALRPSDPLARLLQEAQERLRAGASQAPNPQERPRLVTSSIARAIDLEKAGDLEGGLGEIQTALALDPRSTEALSVERRLLEARLAAGARVGQEASVRELLATAAAELAEGRPAEALQAANRVLALEPANEAALRQIARAYRELSDALLSPDKASPVIALNRLAEPSPGDAAVTRVASPLYVLGGTVYDGTRVKVTVESAGQAVGAVTVRERRFEGVWITDFSWRHEVSSGRSRFEVVAVDLNGNESRIEHELEYIVPFVRSIWFPLTTIAGLAAIAGAWFAVRLRRQRRLLRDRFNPYVAGAPILEQARFFGREQLLDYVLRRIPNNSVMLYGERRIGKTSLQHQLKKRLTALQDATFDFYPVFIDLQGTPQEKFFATLAAEIFHELAPKLGGLSPSSPTGQLSYGYAELVKDLQAALKALRERSSKRIKLVLLIDEVDELNEYDPRVNQRLRSLFMRTFADDLVAVVSGVAIKKQWEREGSPWYNFFQEIEVKPFDLAEARALVEAPMRGVFAFESGTTDEIIRRTLGKPYLIQRLCSSLVDRLHEQRRRTITANDVAAACRAEGL